MSRRDSDGLRILSGEDCAALLEDLSGALAKADLKLEGLELWGDLEDVRWLATQKEPVLQSLEDPRDPNRERRIRGFKDAVFVKRSIKALELTRGYAGWQTPAIHLRHWRIRDVPGDEDSLAVQQAQQALDYLYEIEVAARLGFTFTNLRFAEPDLLIKAPDSPIEWTIACKRPRGTRSVLRATRKAVNQITRAQRLGVVMISLDNIVDPIVMDVSGASLEPRCQGRMTASTDGCRTDILAEIEPCPPVPAKPDASTAGRGVMGVLTTASFLLLGKDGPGGPVFLNTRMEPCMINRKEPRWAQEAMWYLLGKLKSGDESVKTRY